MSYKGQTRPIPETSRFRETGTYSTNIHVPFGPGKIAGIYMPQSYSVIEIPHGLFVVAHDICRDCGKSLIIDPDPFVVEKMFRKSNGYIEV